jgi:hypothetical protein
LAAEDDDEDDYIDTDSLGDWRNFRKSLTMTAEKPRPVSKENEELLASQNQQLFQEYKSGAWAHETSTVRYMTSKQWAVLAFTNSHLCASSLATFCNCGLCTAGNWWFSRTNAVRDGIVSQL